ncbi:MAG: acetate--CoA ligase family protein [Chloroflexota bacterium]
MNLKKLFNAQSIAVVGASNKPSSFGGQVIKNLVDYGYEGQIYGVHPRETAVYNQPCYPSLTAIPEPPDCVALAIANHHLLRTLTEAGELGIKAAVVFGDPTVGAGRAPELEGEINELAQKYGIAICGANAMGYYALPHKLAISGYPVDPEKPVGNVALITHSGTVFDSMTQNNRDVHFNYVVSGGNETVLTAADYLQFVLEDPTTKAVALYLETVRDPEGFVKGLETAVSRQIPIIALKTGLSERGQAMTQAHTGALAGGAEAYAALFAKYGVRQVFTLDEMMDTIELFSRIQTLSTPNISALMESGGERSLFVDIATDVGAELTVFDEPTNEWLASVVEEGVEPDNPLDAFGTGAAVVETYRDCLLAMHDDPNTGLLLLAVDMARDSYLSHDYTAAALEALPNITKPFATLVNLTAGANDDLIAQLRANGVPVLMGTDTGLKAIHHLAAFSAFKQKAATVPVFLGRPAPEIVVNIHHQLSFTDKPLDEYASKNLLARYGLPVAAEGIVHSADEAVRVADSIGYPVVAKTAVSSILHKSEANGIHLNLKDGEAIRAAYGDLSERLGTAVLIQEMVTEGVEMILGMKNDPQFGPLLVVGMGGIFVEIYKDVVTVLPPLTREEAASLPMRFIGKDLLLGARGRPPVNLDVLTDVILRFATFIYDHGKLISEIDLNPIKVSAAGATIVDALIITHGST